ncbi:MAG TPA: DcaP family trimeric outer membrane transporter, partial [Rhodocyclaceae bacterium]|nr:DcaP family trimeric outer membrane transporter [Rhodocyclaceae bacterium]
MMLRILLCWSVFFFSIPTSAAQTEQPTSAELMAEIQALRRRVEELETRQQDTQIRAEPTRAAAREPKRKLQPQEGIEVEAEDALKAWAVVQPAPYDPAPVLQQAATSVPGLRPPEPMGSQFEDALRSDLPGISMRVPGTNTEVRVYGFAKASAHSDFNGRNQSDAPPPFAIPLTGSLADIQGGDFGMTARFSRIGMDSRTLTSLGTLETRIEGDFGGGAPVSNNAVFRLRQAWAELGTDEFRVLFGQANSLWNEGMFETLNDATNLNQSFVRQPQIRAISQLAHGLTGQVSLEWPDTQYTSRDGVITTAGGVAGGLSPAFTSVPDVLARLTYRHDGLEIDARGLLRQLSIRTAGTAAAPPALSDDILGGGVAGRVLFPMRWLSDAFGPDQLIGATYYGEGLGRYFAGNSNGQDAISSVGLPGADPSFDAVTSYGATLAYRLFWTPQLRSNIAYSYAWHDYPDYARSFTPGSAAATSLNRELQQGVFNFIWSPFAQLRGTTVDTGWLDVGLEYVYAERDIFHGATASG